MCRWSFTQRFAIEVLQTPNNCVSNDSHGPGVSIVSVSQPMQIERKQQVTHTCDRKVERTVGVTAIETVAVFMVAGSSDKTQGRPVKVNKTHPSLKHTAGTRGVVVVGVKPGWNSHRSTHPSAVDTRKYL